MSHFPISEAVTHVGEPAGELTVSLSNELVSLLSEQLYRSPIKAVEELVVNSFDAEAKFCRIYIPRTAEHRRAVLVYDDGIGMDYVGLTDLWQIGRSNKRSEEISKRANRKQIGKFGIGKLATYTIANRLTYITRSNEEVLVVSIDFRSFDHKEEDAGTGDDKMASNVGQMEPITLPVSRITDLEALYHESEFRDLCALIGIAPKVILRPGKRRWTFALLEELKEEKLRQIKFGTLRWVLSTAIPLERKFRVYLNKEEVESSKAQLTALVSFEISELPEKRLRDLERSTGEEWLACDGRLYSDSLKEGVSGRVIVTSKSLHEGKSADLGRSHGFFIRVRGRLINQDDPLFGLTPRSYETFNRFRAEVYADDLDATLTASRESVERSRQKENIEYLLAEIFNEARIRYKTALEELADEELRKKEHDRNVVDTHLVEKPIADALTRNGNEDEGAEADETWFYVERPIESDVGDLVSDLYEKTTRKYVYRYERTGRTGRIVRFEPRHGIFWLNEDHDFVMAHSDDPRAQVLLRDFVTAEALLEVYLRNSGVAPHTIGEVLERRDSLLRSLAKDHPYSMRAIARALRDAVNDDHELEVALVTAIRALGFVAKHIGGPDRPDGIARLKDYPGGEKKISLEAKSSTSVPSLNDMEFAGLRVHADADDIKADGVLLVAPAYPGLTRGDDSGAAKRAATTRVSCWTADQLADVVEASEKRQLTARNVIDIVMKYFTPEEVEQQVRKLLSEPKWTEHDLYSAIVAAIADLEDRLPDSLRTLDMISGEVSREETFKGITKERVESAIRDLAAASHGAMRIRDHAVILHVDPEEIARRVSHLTTQVATPRRDGRF